jgi:hypothetical protein
VTAGVLIALLIAMRLSERFYLLTERGVQLLLITPLWIALALIAVASLVTCYYVFRVGLCKSGLGYALGHALLCMALSCAGLIGIIVVPLQVRWDIQRWRKEGVDGPSEEK